MWVTSIANALDRLLPEGDHAELAAHGGGRVEVDIGSFEESRLSKPTTRSEGGAALAEAPTWVAPPPTMRVPLEFPDQIEALVSSDMNVLVEAVELISPGNKDRAGSRKAFAAKCATSLHEGVGVVIVAIVTNRTGDLHGELMAMQGAERTGLDLYATAIRPVRRPQVERLDTWVQPLEVGAPLPSLPLVRGPRLMVRLDLDSNYHNACRHSRPA